MATLLCKNGCVRKLAKRLLWIKRHQPAKYRTISFLTDGMVLGLWCILSVSIALFFIGLGYVSFDAAMIIVALLTLDFVEAMSLFV